MRKKVYVTIAVVLLLMGCSKQKDVIKQIQQEEYEKAYNSYVTVLADKNVELESFKQEIQIEIDKQLEEDFKEKNYAKAILRISELEKMEIVSEFLLAKKERAKILETSEANYVAGTLAYKGGQREEALQFFSRVSKVDQANYDKAVSLTNQINFDIGEELWEQGDVDGAMSALEAVTDRNVELHRKAQALLTEAKENYVLQEVGNAYKAYINGDFSSAILSMENALAEEEIQELKELKRLYELAALTDINETDYDLSENPKTYMKGSNKGIGEKFFLYESLADKKLYLRVSDTCWCGKFKEIQVETDDKEERFTLPLDESKVRMKTGWSMNVVWADVPVSSIYDQLLSIVDNEHFIVTADKSRVIPLDGSESIKALKNMWEYYELKQKYTAEYIFETLFQEIKA